MIEEASSDQAGLRYFKPTWSMVFVYLLKEFSFQKDNLRYKEGESISMYTPALNIIINLYVLVKLKCIVLDLFSFF